MIDGIKAQIPDAVLAVAKALVAAGHVAYLVGGCVRDFAMGKEPNDFDLATDAVPERMLSLFPTAKATGLRFGTVTVVMDGLPIEVTTFRTEGPYLDGRHPSEVTFGASLEEDLARRDFTMNAMALDPLTLRLADPEDGMRDIEAKVVRSVGDARIRFAEDRLRMLRAVRFASTLAFSIDPDTVAAIVEGAREIRQVSQERITAELDKLLLAPTPSRGVELLRETGMLQTILPETMQGWGVAQNKYHEFTVYYHTMGCLDQVPPVPLLRWAALLHDVGKPKVKQGEHFYGHEKVGAEMATRIMDRLKLPNKFNKAVTHLIANHMVGYNSKWSDGAIRRLISRVGRENIPDFLELHRADMASKGNTVADDKMAKYNEFRRRVEAEMSGKRPLTIKDLAVDGNDVTRVLGRPGPSVGQVLQTLLEMVIDNPSLNKKDKLLAMAAKMINSDKRGRSTRPQEKNGIGRSPKVMDISSEERMGREHSENH